MGPSRWHTSSSSAGSIWRFRPSSAVGWRLKGPIVPHGSVSFPWAGEPRSTRAEGAEPEKTNEQDWSAVQQGAQLKGLGRGFEGAAAVVMVIPMMELNILMQAIVII